MNTAEYRIPAIVSVETIAVRLPRDLASATGTAGTPNALAGDGGYRWSRDYPALYSVFIETALVKVTLDNGLTGWGEAQAPLAPEVACTIVERLLRPVLLGEAFDGSVPRIEELWQRIYNTMRVRGQTGGFMLDAVSGIDIALWDLAGKMAGKPVCQLLAGGPPQRTVPAYMSGLAGETIEAKLETARRYWKEGFRTFKLYFESDWEFLMTQIDALRREFGPHTRVAVDALWHLDPAKAKSRAADLDARNVLWLECPFPPEETYLHARLARSIQTPLALGESYRTRFELAAFFKTHTIGVVQPDLGRSGVTESRRIATIAEQENLDVVPHVSIAMAPQIAAAIHFAAATANAPMCEYNPHVLTAANRFLREPLQMEGAAYKVPRAPGLGVDIDEAALRGSIVG